jgi:hypothetical protein
MNCVCRTGLQSCDYLCKVCLVLDKSSIKSVNEGTTEFSFKAEAEELILKTHQKGLVHLVDHLSFISVIPA